MLYDVVTSTGGNVVTGVSLNDAKRFLRAYCEGFDWNPALKVELKGWVVYGSIRGKEPFNLWWFVERKMKYNEQRPMLNGKKY